jgi:hypothetical protein
MIELNLNSGWLTILALIIALPFILILAAFTFIFFLILAILIICASPLILLYLLIERFL